MSPVVLGGNAIPTVLVGANNFSTWFQRITTFISTTNMEWREYLLTGDFIESRSGINLSVNEISYIKGVLDQGIYLLVIHSVNEEIKQLIEPLYDNDQSLNARGVLNYLKDKFADMKVRG